MDEAPYIVVNDRVLELRLNRFNRKMLPVSEDLTTETITAGRYERAWSPILGRSIELIPKIHAMKN